MLFDLLMVTIIVIVVIFSCCGFLTKLRHYEEQRKRAAEPGIPTIVVEGSGIFPASCGPPPYIEHDLPPKYEEVMKNNKEYPGVHLSKASLEKVVSHP